MSFATALSGLKAASTSLQVTGNNIANSQTTGFKQSRAEFADVYASSLGGVSRTQAGSGVRVTEVAQQFNDGNIEATQNSLDLAISGNGFFVLADTGNLPDPADKAAPVDPSVPSAYTRNGAFQLNSAGNVVNDKGQYLLAFAANGTTAAEGFSTGVFRPITVDTSQGLPSATTNINLDLTINSGAVTPTAVFSPTDPKSYNNTTSVTTYDSQGNAHIAATYYVKTPVANVWDAYLFIDNFGITTGGQAVPPNPAKPSTVANAINTPGLPIPITFNSGGLLGEVGVRAAAVATAAIAAAAKTAATDTTDAQTAADAADTALGADPALNATALSAATAASASASAMASAAATINSVPGLATEAQNALDAATTAAASALTALNSATVLVNIDPTDSAAQATAAATAAADAAVAATDAAAAKAAIAIYNTDVKKAAANATQATQVDFGNINLTAIDPNIKVDPMAFSVDFTTTTQITSPFSVKGASQDGLPAGNLTGIDVDDTGVVFAKYSNGGSKALGQVALARFPSNQSLAKLGDTTWGKTANSGTPVYGAAGDNNFGGIQSSALEGSNVDLSDQLVKLIIQQQAYQANSQTITTEKTLVDTILRA